MKLLVLILCFTAFYGCGNQKDNFKLVKSYFENGNLKSKTPYLNNLKEGTYEEFYENGNLKMMVQFHNNKKEGLLAEFSENKFQINESFFDNDQEVLFKEFQYTSDLKFIKEEIYLNELDHSVKIGEIIYDHDWEVLPEKSWYYSIDLDIDTLKIGEMGLANFKIYPMKGFNNIKILINLIDKNNTYFASDTIAIFDNKYELKLKGNQLGLNKIRGKIILESNRNLSGEYKKVEIPIYENFFVKRK